MNKLALIGGLLSACTWGYVAWGQEGLIPRSSGRSLPLPESQANEQGATTAKMDVAAWRAACEASGLPGFLDPNSVEYEPMRILVQASERWAQSGDGDELGLMGEVAMSLKYHELAIDYFAAAVELGENKERWQYFLGVECQAIGAFPAAITALEAARDLNPDYATTYTRLGSIQFELGQLDAADQNYALASEREPSPTAGVVGRGRVAIARGDFEAALGYLDQAIAQTPQDFLAHRLRSQALAALDRHEEAASAAQMSNRLPHYRGWLTFDPRLVEASETASTQSSLEVAFNLAMDQGDIKAASVAGAALLKRLPNSPQILVVLSRVYANSGKAPEGFQLAQRAVDLEPQNLKALAALADIATAVGEIEAGISAAQQMVAIAPKYGKAHQSLGRLYYKQGKIEACLKELRIAVNLEPRSVTHRLMLADVLQRNQRIGEAVHELEGVLAIDPQNAQAAQQLQILKAR